MKDYLVRVGYFNHDQFYEFCKQHKISQRHISHDGWQDDTPSELYAARMTSGDAMILKLSMKIDIMEIK